MKQWIHTSSVGGRPVLHVEMEYDELVRLLNLPKSTPQTVVVTARKED